MKKLLFLALCTFFHTTFCFSQNTKIDILKKDIKSMKELTNTISGAPFANYSEMKNTWNSIREFPELFGLSLHIPNIFIYKEYGEVCLVSYEAVKITKDKVIWWETKMGGITSLWIKKGTAIVYRH